MRRSSEGCKGRGRESVFLSLETSYTESALVPGFWGSGHQGISRWRADGGL